MFITKGQKAHLPHLRKNFKNFKKFQKISTKSRMIKSNSKSTRTIGKYLRKFLSYVYEALSDLYAEF